MSNANLDTALADRIERLSGNMQKIQKQTDHLQSAIRQAMKPQVDQPNFAPFGIRKGESLLSSSIHEIAGPRS